MKRIPGYHALGQVMFGLLIFGHENLVHSTGEIGRSLEHL